MSANSVLSWKYAAATSVVLAGVWAVTAFSQTGSEEKKGGSLRTVKATTGTIQRTVRVTGTTSARKFASIAAPMMRGPDAGRALVLFELVKSGSWVKKGDTVAAIDPETIKTHVDEVHSQVIQADADIKKRRAEQAIDWENLQQTLRATKAELDKSKLEAGASEVRTEVDAEILKLQVEEYEAQYKQQLADLKIKQESFKSEIRILELTRDRHARHRDRHKVDVERFTMRAPMDGLVVMQSVWRSGEMGQIQQGDQVAPGQPFMKIVDPSSMQIEATISQTGSDDLRIGQPADVRFDAFPDLRMQAKVYSIGAIAVGGFRQNAYIRNLPVRLSIQGADKRIIPDLSTSAEIMLEKKDNATILPFDAIHADRSGNPIVYVRKGEQWERRPVKIGISSNNKVSVEEGVRAGEEVSLVVPPAGPKVTS